MNPKRLAKRLATLVVLILIPYIAAYVLHTTPENTWWLPPTLATLFLSWLGAFITGITMSVERDD